MPLDTPTNYAPHTGQTAELPVLDGLALSVGEHTMALITGADRGKVISGANTTGYRYTGFVSVQPVGPGNNLRATLVQAGTFWLPFDHVVLNTDHGDLVYLADNEKLTLASALDPTPVFVVVGILRQAHLLNNTYGLVTLIPGLGAILA